MSRILVIDDDMMVTQLLEEFLKGEGHEVVVMHLGDEGFKKALEFEPDLILQDVMLPDATGFQMVDRFRQDPNTKSIPIIMMSGAARHPNQQKLGNLMGADDYILKPFNIDDIDNRIQKLLRGAPPRTKSTPTLQPSIQLPIQPIIQPSIQVPLEPLLPPTLPTPPPVMPPPMMPPPITPIPTQNEPPPFVLPSTPPALPQETPFETPVPAFETPKTPMREPIRIIPILNEPTEWSTTPIEKPPQVLPVVEKPVIPETPIPVQKVLPSPPRFKVALILYGVHLLLSAMANLNVETPVLSIVQAITHVTATWAILAGLILVTCAVGGITLEAWQGLRMVGWAMIPLVGRSFVALLGIGKALGSDPSQNYWLKPPDFFELAAVFLVGMRMRTLPGSSQAKAILCSLVIFFFWALTGQFK